MMNLAIRNWRLYIRDRAAVLYSLLAVFIIIGLYILFLGDNMVKWVADVPGGRFLIDSWIMGGLITVTSFTTTLGALGTIVEDRDRKISKDFQASPLKRSQILSGYIISAMMIGFMMCCVTLVLAEVYIVLKGGSVLPMMNILKMLGIIVLSVMTSASILFPVVMTIKSTSAYSGVSTVAGTLIGFLTGMYLPIGELPSAVQTVIKVFPLSHAGALMRKVMTEVPKAEIFAGLPAEAATQFSTEFDTLTGVTLQFGNHVMTSLEHILVLLGTTAVFFLLSVLIVNRKRTV